MEPKNVEILSFKEPKIDILVKNRNLGLTMEIVV